LSETALLNAEIMNTEDGKNNEEMNDTNEFAQQEQDVLADSNDTDQSNHTDMSPLEKKELEYNELHDKFIRLFSEFDNYRKRTAKEKLDLTLTAGSDIVIELLPIIDDFERAITNNEKTEELAQVKEGFLLIYNKLINNLNRKGLAVMDAKDQPFDADKHEALTQIPAPTAELKGKVVDVLEKGYTLNDKIVRFAKVVVGQ
jgi:molecular chaperone GrpE